MQNTNTAALFAAANITVKRETGRGFVVRRNGVEVASAKRKSDALSLGVVAALA